MEWNVKVLFNASPCFLYYHFSHICLIVKITWCFYWKCRSPLHCTPAWETECDSISKKKRERKKKCRSLGPTPTWEIRITTARSHPYVSHVFWDLIISWEEGLWVMAGKANYLPITSWKSNTVLAELEKLGQLSNIWDQGKTKCLVNFPSWMNSWLALLIFSRVGFLQMKYEHLAQGT